MFLMLIPLTIVWWSTYSTLVDMGTGWIWSLSHRD